MATELAGGQGTDDVSSSVPVQFSSLYEYQIDVEYRNVSI